MVDSGDVSDRDFAEEDDSLTIPHIRLVADNERPAPETLTFEEVCLQYRDEMVSYAHKLTGNRERAEDIVQDAMLRALTAWDRWVPDGEPMMSARAWLYRIVANTFTKAYHKSRRYCVAIEKDRNSIADFTSADGDELATWQQHGSVQARRAEQEVSDEVRDAIASLHPNHRELIEIVYLDDVQPIEAAKRLGISEGTMWSRLSRARANLARQLKRFARDNYAFQALAVPAPAAADDVEVAEQLAAAAVG